MDKLAITKNVIDWLVNGANYKPTFKLFTLHYTEKEKDFAMKVVEAVLDNGDIINKFYDVENSFTMYTKLSFEEVAAKLGVSFD